MANISYIFLLRQKNIFYYFCIKEYLYYNGLPRHVTISWRPICTALTIGILNIDV